MTDNIRILFLAVSLSLCSCSRVSEVDEIKWKSQIDASIPQIDLTGKYEQYTIRRHVFAFEKNGGTTFIPMHTIYIDDKPLFEMFAVSASGCQIDPAYSYKISDVMVNGELKIESISLRKNDDFIEIPRKMLTAVMTDGERVSGMSQKEQGHKQ